MSLLVDVVKESADRGHYRRRTRAVDQVEAVSRPGSSMYPTVASDTDRKRSTNARAPSTGMSPSLLPTTSVLRP